MKHTRKYSSTSTGRNLALLIHFGLCCCLLLSLPNACNAFIHNQFPETNPVLSTRRATTPIYSTTSSVELVPEAPTTTRLSDLKVAIAGAGPSGLLLAHLLLQQGAQVSIYESRPDPRSIKGALAGFAYALGLGIRGRTAIRGVDDRLWQAVKQKGNECDRFRLHVGPFNFKLRDSGKRRKDSKKGTLEPSLLLYQSDLCIALIEELERRYGDFCNLNFQYRVLDCDLKAKTMTVDMMKNLTTSQSYDLLVGCDGVNSVVRSAIKDASPRFSAEKQTLPGEFKVARLEATPPKLDPNSVALLVPKKGSSTAFIEPTVNGSCCVLFAGRGGPDSQILSPRRDHDENRTEALAETLLESFPLLEGADLRNIAEQLISQKPGTASSVSCNVYHYDCSVAITGDAAHATGGVSGQGVNSALLDSLALSDCLLQCFNAMDKENSLETALLTYSRRQVPEGKALYDLSFGPKPSGVKKIIFTLRGIRDTIFQGRFGIGKKPLQTILTTTMEPFSSVRRKMDYFYDEPFPDAASFNNTIAAVYTNKNMVEELKKIRRL